MLALNQTYCRVIGVTLMLLASQAVYGGECAPVQLSVTGVVQRGPTCLVAAVSTAASGQASKIEFHELARHVPVYPDGVHVFDVITELKRRGLHSIVFQAPAEGTARLIEAGFSVVTMQKGSAGKHSIVVTGIQRASIDGRCTPKLKSLRVFDPANGRHTWQAKAAFEANQLAGQQLVIFTPEDEGKLAKKGFPTAIAKRQHGQFMSNELLNRAKRHTAVNAQAVTLLQRSLAFDPCNEEARALLKSGHSAHLKTTPKCENPTVGRHR